MKVVCALQADKLIFISSQAAVQHHGNETALFEQDIAAMRFNKKKRISSVQVKRCQIKIMMKYTETTVPQMCCDKA